MNPSDCAVFGPHYMEPPLLLSQGVQRRTFYHRGWQLGGDELCFWGTRAIGSGEDSQPIMELEFMIINGMLAKFRQDWIWHDFDMR